MQHIKFGDITTMKAGILMHGCNAQGFMGSGVAKTIRIKFPRVYDAYVYQDMESIVGLRLGDVIFAKPSDSSKIIVANAITQVDFGTQKRQVDYGAIYDCAVRVKEVAVERMMDVHYPLIGAGLGGGDWAIISDILKSVFDDDQEIEHYLWIYER